MNITRRLAALLLVLGPAVASCDIPHLPYDPYIWDGPTPEHPNPAGWWWLPVPETGEPPVAP